MGPTLTGFAPGTLLEHSPDLIRLRLPSRAGWPARIGYGILTVLVLAPAVIMATVKQPAYGAAAVAGCLGVAFLATVYVAALWSLRQGVLVLLTPDRLTVRKHWSDGGESIELFLGQVRLEESKRAIVVRRGRKVFRIGSALTPDTRRSVVEFLNAEIARHLRPGSGSLGPDSSLPDGGLSVPLRPEELELLGLALCGPFRDCDVGKVHIAPAIPQPVLAMALQSYLDLREDEVLLAILGVDGKGAGGPGCALTSRRIYWQGKTASGTTGNRPARCESVEYAALPETIGRTGLGGATLDLGEGRRVRLGGAGPLADATARYLRNVRALARGELTPLGIPDADRDQAWAAWHRVVAAGSAARAFQAEIRSFHDRAYVVSRARVTAALVVACVAVFVAMVASGVSAINPSAQQVLAWGADFGPSVVFDRQYWRLLTSMFLHFGLVHILMNMFCLVTSGPVVERFFGHFGFAAIYVLSGIGGAVASLWVHPTLISAGASGAIFGIFGGLLGYLAIHHRDVPTALLRPMRSGALAFIFYNTIFSLGVPGIDTAAHLGGLVTGFACGLLLTAVGPALSVRRVVVVVLPAAVLGGLGYASLDVARTRILEDPKMGPLIRSSIDAAPAWNSFSERSKPVFDEFERIAQAIDKLSDEIPNGGISKATFDSNLGRIKADCQALGAMILKLPAANPEIEAIRGHMTAAHNFQLMMVESLQQMASRDGSRIEGSSRFNTSVEGYVKEFESIKALRDAYFRAHDLKLEPDAR